MQSKSYSFGGKTYTQATPVLGQLLQLSKILGDASIPSAKDGAALAAALGDALFLFLAVILVPEGEPLQAKDTEALALELQKNCPASTALEVLNDFFGWPELVEEFTAANLTLVMMGETVRASASARESSGMNSPTTLSTGPSCSAGETSPDGKMCSGACAPEK